MVTNSETTVYKSFLRLDSMKEIEYPQLRNLVNKKIKKFKKENPVIPVQPRTIDISIVEELTIKDARKVLDYVTKLKRAKK